MSSIKVKPLNFPKNFVWGVATAAPQIEGAAFEDGKGESIWDRFARIPGKVHNGDTLDVANDHYHLYGQDFALMRKLGLKNYRLSIAWPRIYPNGDGEVNPAGLAFYNKLIDSCLKHGITPWVTLFHWDLPQSLEDRGGWTSRATTDAFAVYAETVVKALGDRVKNWITLNEIVCFTLLGYSKVGDKAPGRDESAKVVNQTYHHALLCHGHAVKAVRNFGGKGARVGITDNSSIPIPVTETPADIAAARAWFVERNSRILEPIYTGRYSADHKKRMGKDMPDVQKGDLGLISLPTDFLGLNLYTATYVRAAKGKRYEELPLPADFPRSSCPWLNIMPQTLYWGTRLPAEVYGVKAIYITESGCGYDVETLVNGEVHDLHRRDLVRNYLHELHRAIGDGVPVKGYFLWSFMDNYEWQDGYARRFGIVHVDFKTQKRTPKTSAKWYAKVIAENRLV